MDGKYVRLDRWNGPDHLSFSVAYGVESTSAVIGKWSLESVAGYPGPFSVYEEPLSDDQLIVAWERNAERIRRNDPGCQDAETWAGAYELCAKQLRERKL